MIISAEQPAHVRKAGDQLLVVEICPKALQHAQVRLCRPVVERVATQGLANERFVGFRPVQKLGQAAAVQGPP